TAAAAAAVLAWFAPLFGRQRDWLPFAFYLWVNVYGLILVAQFWAFVTSIPDPQLAKRMIGLIGVGGILGGLAGGLGATVLARGVRLSTLVLMGAGLTAAVVPLVLATVGKPMTPPEVMEPEKTTRPWRSPYIRWL